MLFNSLSFFEFLTVVYVAYRILPFRWQNIMLLVAGYVFYGCWDVRFLFVISFSTAVDFSIGLLMVQGYMPALQRVTVSLFLVGAALFFLCPNWSALNSPGLDFELTSVLTPQTMGFQVLAGTAIFVVGANLLIDRIPRLPETRRRKALILCSVLVNLGFLGFFKYFNFFIGSAEGLFRAMGIDSANLRLSVVLPVGISFYTFQSLSYTIDVYRNRMAPKTRFWDFALFVAYFPPLVAGPIERGWHLLPQLSAPRRIRLGQSMDGIVLILLGLFKKVAIADGIAPAVDSVFATSGTVSQTDVALATFYFAIQIFCDFSGYSDIARGVSKLFGIELILNFNLPYFSKNPREFWRRWHISLSSWLRDYLYVPLGGNRLGGTRTYFNLMVTMLLGGLWHGAPWNFVLLGGYQGALLCGHRLLTHGRHTLPTSGEAVSGATDLHGGARRTPRVFPSWLSTPLRIFVFFVFCCYGWLLFRARSLDQIKTFTALLLGFGERHAPSVISKPTTAATIGTLILILLQFSDYRAGKLESFTSWWPPLQGLLYATLIFVLIMGMSNAPAQFIYFQF
jgi:D-alanyl-lipoteichoic acid acyltransferase DltB (MBOAT superfamily)